MVHRRQLESAPAFGNVHDAALEAFELAAHDVDPRVLPALEVAVRQPDPAELDTHEVPGGVAYEPEVESRDGSVAAEE